MERHNVPPVNNLITFGSQHMGVSDLPLCSPGDVLCQIARRAARFGVYSKYAQTNLIQVSIIRILLSSMGEVPNFQIDPISGAILP